MAVCNSTGAPACHRPDVLVPYALLTEAIFCLDGTTRWIRNRELMPLTPVVRALLEEAERTATHLAAVLRMAEPGEGTDTRNAI